MGETDTLLVDRYLEATRRAGLDQTEAAERIGMTQQGISEWVAKRARGERVTIRKTAVRRELRDFILQGPGVNKDFRDGLRYAVEQMDRVLREMQARLNAAGNGDDAPEL